MSTPLVPAQLAAHLRVTALTCDQPTVNGRIYSKAVVDAAMAKLGANTTLPLKAAPSDPNSSTFDKWPIVGLAHQPRREGENLTVECCVRPESHAITEGLTLGHLEVRPLGAGEVNDTTNHVENFELLGFSISRKE